MGFAGTSLKVWGLEGRGYGGYGMWWFVWKATWTTLTGDACLVHGIACVGVSDGLCEVSRRFDGQIPFQSTSRSALQCALSAVLFLSYVASGELAVISVVVPYDCRLHTEMVEECRTRSLTTWSKA